MSRRSSHPTGDGAQRHEAAVPAGLDPVPAGLAGPLEPALRQDMERRFGANFAGVRVHSGGDAARLARRLDANAYAIGEDIVFAEGRYAPESEGGRRLIAHELSHVQEQRGGGARRAQRSPAGEPELMPETPLEKPVEQVVNGVTYYPVWDAAAEAWDFRNAGGRSFYSSVISGEPDPAAAPAVPHPFGSPVARFWAGVAAVRVETQARALAEEAVARMVKEKGPRLRKIALDLDYYRGEMRARLLLDREWQSYLALEAEKKEIVNSYNPANQRGPSTTIPWAIAMSLPYSTTAQPLHGPHEISQQLMDPQQNARYAPDIVPQKGAKFGKYGGYTFEHDAVRSSVGDAYAYNIETDMFQVANDLERLARAGYTEIHIATGTHGDPIGGLDPEFRFLRQDARSIMETGQRNSGLNIIPYNMADPVQAARFDAVQALAADGRLPGGATVAAFCFSRTRVLDPNQAPAGPYATADVLDGRTPLSSSFLRGGLAAGAGALDFYAGLKDPNRELGLIRMAGGGAQMLGGAGYAAGYALDSARLARYGSRLATAGGYVTAPFLGIDFHRFLQSKVQGPVDQSGDPDLLFADTNFAFALASTIFPELALGALVTTAVVKPVASKAAEIATPIFVEGISGLTGIPSQYIWGMH